MVGLYRLNKKKLAEVRKFVAEKHGIKLHDESKDLSHERYVENVIVALDPKHLRKIKKAQGLVRKGKCHTYKEVINFLNTK